MNIFVIDKASKKNVGIIDFIPQKGDRIVVKPSLWKNCECIVECILYCPEDHGVIIWVSMVEPYYYNMLKDIEWH